MMLYTDPPKHTRYRLLVNKGFTPRMIGLLEQYLTHRAILIVDNVIERGSCDFVVDLASELPLQAIAEIMGVPQEDRQLLFDWSNRMIGARRPRVRRRRRRRRARASAELYMYVNELAKQRKTDPRDDIVTKLINAEIEGDKLSELEFDMFMLLLAVAGNETTRNTTAWGMWALMQNPEQYKALRDDLDGTLDRAIEEILRWATPVYHFRRTRHGRHRDPRPGDQAGRQGRHLAHLGQPRRDGVRRPVPFDIDALAQRAHRVRRRRPPLLPRRQPRPHGAAADLRRDPRAHPRHAPGRRAVECCARTSSAASSTCRSSTPPARRRTPLPSPSATDNRYSRCSTTNGTSRPKVEPRAPA